MNKRNIIILLLIVSITLILLFFHLNRVNNHNTLNTPTELTVLLNDNTLAWKGDNRAIGYLVWVNGTETEVVSTVYSLSGLTVPDVYEIKVMALSDGKRYENSFWSRTIEYRKD